jgi:ABC-2 type transport system ATP-binding protein
MRHLIVRAEKLTKFYGPQRGIEDLTFEVEPGEVFGLLGPALAGKTTTLRILLDLVRPTRGSAYLFNLDIRKNSLAVRKRIGYAPAEFPSVKRQTGRQLLQLLASFQPQANFAAAQELAASLELDLDTPIPCLPASSRQKLNLVQANLHQPELLLLDEPGRCLDPEARPAYHRWVHAMRNEGRSVVLASSSLAEIERLCDRVAILWGGKLVSLERVIQLKARLLRRVEIRFAEQVSLEPFMAIPNLQNLSLERSTLRCTVKGDPDRLIKAAGQFRVSDLICKASNIDDVMSAYYGEGTYAA